MKYKVLITGGAGFIGSHIADSLIEKGHEVCIYDNLDSQVHASFPKYLNKKAEFVKADVRDREGLKKAISESDIIFHEASIVGVGQSMYEIRRYIDVNLVGTSTLLDILVNEEHDVKKVVLASSMTVYGEGSYACTDCGIFHPKNRDKKMLKNRIWDVSCKKCKKTAKPIKTSERALKSPKSIYAISKKTQEDICLKIGKTYGIPTVILRYFNVYGSRQSLTNPYTGVCAIFISRIKNDKQPIIFEDGNQKRDFVHVKDIVNANILSMEKSSADYGIFNVGTGEGRTIIEIANILIKIFGKALKPKITNRYRTGDIRHCFADISKIKDKLSYKPKIMLEDGMKELVNWSLSVKSIDKFKIAYDEIKKRGLV